VFCPQVCGSSSIYALAFCYTPTMLLLLLLLLLLVLLLLEL